MFDDHDNCEWVNVFFWYRPTWVVPNKGPLKGCVWMCILRKGMSQPLMLAVICHYIVVAGVKASCYSRLCSQSPSNQGHITAASSQYGPEYRLQTSMTPKVPFLWGDMGRRLIQGFLGPHNPIPQMTSRLVKPFYAQTDRQTNRQMTL